MPSATVTKAEDPNQPIQIPTFDLGIAELETINSEDLSDIFAFEDNNLSDGFSDGNRARKQ